MKEKSISIGMKHDRVIRRHRPEGAMFPKRFRGIHDWLKWQVEGRTELFQRYEGNSIAVICLEPLVAEITSGDVSSVLERGHKRWGNRQFYAVRMDRYAFQPVPMPSSLDFRVVHIRSLT